MHDDFRAAVRALFAARGVTVAALIVLVLGIGAGTAIFSVVDAVVLRGLPFDEHDRLVAIGERSPRVNPTDQAARTRCEVLIYDSDNSGRGGGIVAHFTRREFLKTGLAAGTLAVSGAVPVRLEPASATDVVTLGRSGVKVTRLAFGTGSFSGQVQRELGQDRFTRLVRHAYDRGIRFFETAESYGEMHRMLGIALKGIPRESYQLMSKVTTRDGVDPQQKLDELRRLANIEYFDIILLHWQHTATWPADTARWQDAILEVQSRKVVLSHGASVHGLPALRRVPGNTWLDVAMIRVNHTGKSMDAEDYATQGPGNVPEVVTHVKEVRKQGMGVISMKLAGEGTFDREDRRKAMRFAFRNAGVDCVTVGYKSPAEIDEAIENLNLALA